MSDRKLADARAIYPRALAIWGEATCITALGVARDLRSGDIPAAKYDQGKFFGTSCGAACCIAGHIAFRMNESVENFLRRTLYFNCPADFVGALNLFSSSHPSDPLLAADAIERLVILGSRDPWRT